MRGTTLVVLLFAWVGGAVAMTDVYRVEPVRASWSDMADPEEGVSQVITLNVDTLKQVDVFIGTNEGAGLYDVNVYSHPDGATELARKTNKAFDRSHAWMSCTLDVQYPDSFVKGRRYRIEVTRGTNDSINYHYDFDDPYDYGNMIVGGYGTGLDLCLRVYGVMDTIPETYLGAYPYFPFGGETWGCSKDTWKLRAIEAGLHQVRFRIAWVWVDSALGGADTWRFAGLDTQYWYLTDSIGGCEVYGNPHGATYWSSTHWNEDSMRFELGAPPSGLFLSVDDPLNGWARLVRESAEQYPEIHTLEVWNESNLLEENWKKPDTRDYVGWSSPRERCSIYVRLCEVAKEAVHNVDGHGSDKILVGSLGDLEAEAVDSSTTPWDTLKMKGKDWLRWMYEIADSVFWDGVAFHYYDDVNLSTFEAQAETLRKIMREENGDYGELWVTETGWSTGECSEEVQANSVGEVFVSALASPTRPGGGYDRIDWFSFRNTGASESKPNGDRHGLADTLLQDLKPSFYSFAHTASAMPGLRPNGRVLTGDSGVDATTRIYEFEEPDEGNRVWVCWKNGGAGGGDIEVQVPVRCDSPDTVSLDYDGVSAAPAEADVEPSGWLELSLSERPKFITETGEVARPDLVADSVWSLPPEPQPSQQCSLYVRVVNHGSAATQAGSPISGAPNTVARFYLDDGLIGSWEHSPSIGMGDTVLLAVAWTPNAATQGLLRATVNDDQAYVEEALDDNAAFLLLNIAN